jgi:general secretion pathway protein M
MPANLDASRSRRLALGLLALAAVLVVCAVALPTWLLHRRYDHYLADMYDRLDRYQRIASTRPELARQLEATRAKESRRFFLRSGNTAISAAEAQEALRGVIEQNGGKLITVQAPTSRDDGRYRQITVSVQMTANIIALRRILNALESNTPYLFVDNLVVRTQLQSTFKPAPGQEPEMFVTMDITGYAQIGS